MIVADTNLISYLFLSGPYLEQAEDVLSTLPTKRLYKKQGFGEQDAGCKRRSLEYPSS